MAKNLLEDDKDNTASYVLEIIPYIVLKATWGSLQGGKIQMVLKTNLKDEPKNGLEDILSVCGLSDLKTSSEVVLKTSLGVDPETALQDAFAYTLGVAKSWRR